VTRTVLIIALLFGTTLACAENEGGKSLPGPLVLVAIDGLEWDVMLPLLHEGRLPTIGRLIERGRAGLVTSFEPTLSPILWTTVATGRAPEEHGIRGFVVRGDRRGSRLYNGLDRKAKAFWNILSDFGRPGAVVGWWLTYPVEPIEGVMVAQVNTLGQAFHARGPAVAKGGLLEDLDRQVHPPEWTERVLGVHERVTDRLPDLIPKIFGGLPSELELPLEELVDSTRWSLRADATYGQVVLDLLSEDPDAYDLVAFYLGGTDVVGHRFWRYYEPEAFRHRPAPEEVASFGRVIPDYYLYVDRLLGRILGRVPEATVLIVSDHGMHAANTESVFDGEGAEEGANSGGHSDAPAGVWISAGPGVAGSDDLDPGRLRRPDLPTIGSLYDVAPTILALLGLPVGEDMRGRILTDVMAIEADAIERVATHDDAEWRRARAALSPARAQREAEALRTEQLRALGYID